MTDEPTTREGMVAQTLRQVARRRAYKPTVTVQADGTVLAGGCKLGRVTSGPSGPVLVIEDRCAPRSRARGSCLVEVDVGELADAARRAVEPNPPPSTET